MVTPQVRQNTARTLEPVANDRPRCAVHYSHSTTLTLTRTLRVADLPTVSNPGPLDQPTRRGPGTPIAAPAVVSDERALALGLPSSVEVGVVAPADVVNVRPVAQSDFSTLAAPDSDLANLAARPADTVIETLLGAAHIGLALIDRDLTYRLWNNCLEELFEAPADSVLGCHVDGVRRSIRYGSDCLLKQVQRKRGPRRSSVSIRCQAQSWSGFVSRSHQCSPSTGASMAHC